MPPTEEKIQNGKSNQQQFANPVVTSNDLQDSEPLNVVGVDEPPIFPTKGVEIPEPSPVEEPSTPLTGEFRDLFSELQEGQDFLATESTFRSEQEESSGFTEAQQTLDDLGTRFRDIQREEAAIPIQIQNESEGRGRTAGGIAPIQTGRLRNNAIEALTVASLIDGASNRLVAAERKINRAVEQKYGPAKARVDAIIQNLNLIIQSGELSREETRRAEAVKAKKEAEKAEIEKAEAEQETIWTIASENAAAIASLPNGSRILNKIQSAGSREEALALVADALGETLATEREQSERTAELELDQLEQSIVTEKLQQDEIRARTAKIISESSDVGTEVSEEFASIVDQAAALAGAEDQRETTRKIIAEALAKEDYTTAYSQIANNVEESLTGEVKTKFANSRNDYGIMIGMRDAIKAYTDAGGDVGFLKGTAENIAQNFGQLANDPEFAELGAQLQREFQTYRLNMTGAAFSPEESREYEKVNPSTNKSLDLNLAVIDGALNQLENRIVSTVETRVPNSTSIYDRAVGGGNIVDVEWNDITELGVGTRFTLDGVVYEKVGEDNFIPVD